MAEGRNYRPVIDNSGCQPCQVCLHRCPAETIPEYREEKNSLRGLLTQGESPFRGVDTPSSLPVCQQACPIHQDTRGYAALVARGKFKEALELIREVNPLPAVCGFICHHPCEEACLRSGVDEPLPLRRLKRFVAEWGYKEGFFKKGPKKTRKEKILVIGSGPAGLAAAHDLRLLGYPVTLYEALPVLGGMLAVGVPAFRLPRDILQQEIETIRASGVEMITGQRFPLKDFQKNLQALGFQAAFLAVGAHKNQNLSIPGEKLPGVFPGVELLRKINLGRKVEVGKRVAVIGGGNVAVDAARSILRLGAREVTLLYRRTAKEMPAIAEEVQAAKQEGVALQFLAAPVEIKKNDAGLSLTCLKVRLGAPDVDGRRRPVPLPGSEFTVSADAVVGAVGQRVHPGGANDLKVNQDGTLWADPETGQTSQAQVFAGGDGVTGPGWAIEAIAAGKKGAASIHRFLSGARS
jgi:NADPH-dependent glutamate synthase beta subunit-like oxidoreductase